ncbi:MAG: glycosyltransferase [Clostridia bacterium]
MEEEKFDFSRLPLMEIANRNIKDNIIPLISIITPYYNASKYIMQTATSILNQTFKHFEWIIINDGSTDKDTEEVLENLKKLDNRIIVLNKENAGPASARYFGVQNSKADIVFCLDADDLINNTMLECGYFTLFTNNEATFAYTPFVTFGDSNFLYNHKFNLEDEKKENIIAVASFIRKDKFLELEEYIKLPKEVHEDWYMWLSFFKKGYKPVMMNFYGFWYRSLDTGRLHSINSDNKKANIAHKYINNIAKTINTEIECIQFPQLFNNNYNFYPFEFAKFNKINSSIKKDKKRILFIIPWAVVGGADLFNLNYIKYLKKNNYEISVITTEIHEYDLRQQFEECVDDFFDLTTFLKKEYWPAFISYIMKSRNVDLVFECNSMYGYMIIPWLKSKFPNIPIIDFLHAEQWEWRDGGYPRDSIAVSKFLDATFVCSNHLKEVMQKDMNKKVDNTEVIYLGIDDSIFDPSKKYKIEEEIKAKIKNKKVILFPCRLSYIKRPILMLTIIKKLVEVNKNIVVLVVGDGPAKKDMIKFIDDNKLSEYIIFTNYKADVRPYYAIADLTLICSLSEGITLTAYESLSMGIPVVSSDVGGQRELVSSDVGAIVKNYQSRVKDEFNFDYSEDEINAYLEKIQKIIELDDFSKTDLKNRCRTLILERFSSQIMYRKLTDKIDALIKNGSQIDKNLLNNIEFFERFLVSYNEKEFLQKELNRNYKIIEENNIERTKEIQKLNDSYVYLKEELDKKSEELVGIKSSRSYKAVKKIMRIFKNDGVK